MHRTLTLCRRLLEQSGTPEAQRKGPQRSDCVAPCLRSVLSAKRPARKGKGTEKRLGTILYGGNNLEWKLLSATKSPKRSGVGSTTSYELPTTDYQLSAFRTLRLPYVFAGLNPPVSSCVRAGQSSRLLQSCHHYKESW